MTDTEINAAIEVHRKAIAALEAMRQTSASPTPPPPAAPATARRPIAKRRWELAAKAFRRFPFEPHTVRRICVDHPEWATKLREGAWHVDADMFDAFADLVEAGKASFAVCEKSAVSVAEDVQIPLKL
ncbi:hypothetical protein HAP41_0000006005 [Bradyrhizobium barranii subsp. apii]|uniref:Uncharacterized protein n=1 Tax=Bradyrhizobium barranii subsp. apii TaxID=2819348 RepID=A0A8T5VGB1_9BRAD|nr:hypothetical protein [Bradyrhizobium barranii]UPT88633.1 hypothetical protein HAP41_0000006005 [Bradyrhizobium barranii subsp. apii]